MFCLCRSVGRPYVHDKWMTPIDFGVKGQGAYVSFDISCLFIILIIIFKIFKIFFLLCRARRRRAREGKNISGHQEGLSSDDEENQSEITKYCQERGGDLYIYIINGDFCTQDVHDN